VHQDSELFGFLAILTGAVEIQGMMRNPVFHNGRNRFFNFMDSWVAKLINAAANGADNMVMLLAGIGFFKLRDILSELVLNDQTAIEQEFHGVVQGSAAHPVAVVFHVDIQRFHVEMAIAGIYFIENGKSLGRFAVPLLFDVLRKDLLNRCLHIHAFHT